MRLFSHSTALLAGGMLMLLAPVRAQTPPAQTQPTAPPPIILQPEGQAPPSAPEPAPRPKQRFRIGPELGVFLPTSSKVRDRFGDAWFTFGLGLGPVERLVKPDLFEFDFGLSYRRNDDNHVLLIPVGVKYIHALSATNGELGQAQTTPYVGAAADLYLADVRSQPDNVKSGLTTGVGASVLAGVAFSGSAHVEARYQFVSNIRGFDFSGFSLTLGYRF